MSELRTALADALGPLYRIEREVRPVGEYRLFVATQSQDGSAHPAAVSHGELKAENVLLSDDGVLVADTGIASALGKPATTRNDMAAVQLLTREMLTGAKPTIGEEPLEQTRTLPLWLTEWLRSRWTDAGRALAGMRPPPSSSSQSSQLFA